METKEEYRQFLDSLPKRSRDYIVNKSLKQSLLEIQSEAMMQLLDIYKTNLETLKDGFENIDDIHLFIISSISHSYPDTVIRETAEMLKQDTKLWYDKLLEEEECVLCESKESLHFHHVNPATKNSRFGSMYEMIQANCTLEEIQDEMKKCIVVCKNCHLKKIHKTNRTLSKFGRQIQKLLRRYSDIEI